MLFVFAITLSVNAALLFIIEPMVAKMILPFLGGSPAVWNTSLVFYQASLLAGYAYAHFGSKWLGTKRHALLHLNLVLAALLLLPVTLPLHWFATPAHWPALLVFSVLCAAIGFPFLVLSAGAPLLQKWFAQGGHPASRDPYFLYAASNCGSLVGLLAYPILLERKLTLSEQNQLWFFGYLGLLVLTAICVLLYLRPFSAPADNPPAPSPPRTTDPRSISWGRRGRWLLWSLVPSSLLSGVTTYVTTDIVAAPLFWVIPLAAYLLSFVIAFGRGRWASSSFVVRRQAFLLVGAVLTFASGASHPIYILLPLHLLAFFATALVCHGRLAQDRPPADELTRFYLWISFGGMLGGMFNALLAPVIFTGAAEYPMILVAAAFIRPYLSGRIDSKLSRKLDWLLPSLLAAGMLGIILMRQEVSLLTQANLHYFVFGATGVVCLAFAYRPVRFGAGLAALIVIAAYMPHPFNTLLYRGRSFFGTYRAAYDAEAQRHLLFHGTTIHGAQSAADSSRLQPSFYYHRSGPAGQILRTHKALRPRGQVAIVGLGTGALACHGVRSQHFTFFEIDPLVEKIARDDRLFTYLRDCPPGIDVVLGDARVTLSRAADRQYDLFILDAFSSDSVPVHLLTRQAVELYLDKTTDDGLLLFHISNRYMDLAPVLDRLAAGLNLAAYLQNDFDITPAQRAEGKSASRWILLTRKRQSAAPYLEDSHWIPLKGALGGDLWTDDFSDILKVLYWH